MKIKSLMLVSMFSVLSSAAFMHAAIADTTTAAANAATTVTATCNDGTPYSGTSRKGACSGHKGVKQWDAAAPDAKVWVNSQSKVYHCEGSQFYGKTKDGSYMTESQAKAAGNRADHDKACSK